MAFAVGQVARRRLGAELPNGGGGALRARQRPHLPALAHEAADEAAADEARAPGDERGPLRLHDAGNLTQRSIAPSAAAGGLVSESPAEPPAGPPSGPIYAARTQKARVSTQRLGYVMPNCVAGRPGRHT